MSSGLINYFLMFYVVANFQSCSYTSNRVIAILTMSELVVTSKLFKLEVLHEICCSATF